MRLRVRRRVVYAITALAVLALVGGYVAAELVAGGTGQGQNGFTFAAPASTIYGRPGATATSSLDSATASTCTPNDGTVQVTSGKFAITVFVSGEAACNTTSLEYFEWFNFTSAPLGSAAPGPADSFTVSCDSAPPVAVEVAYSALGPTTVVYTNLYYDVGPTPTAAPCIIAVNGS